MMTVLLLLPTALAFPASQTETADTGDGCRGNVLIDHRPLNNAVDVPPDARLLLAFDQDGCSASTVWVRVLIDQEKYWSEIVDIDATTHLAAWRPDGGWSPGVTYSIEVGQDEDLEDPRTLAFSVGSDPSDTIGDPPTVSIYEAWANEGDKDQGWLDVDLHVSSQSDPLGLTLIQVFDAEASDFPLATKFGSGTGEIEVAVGYEGWVGDDVICLAARQIDATGQATDLGQNACETLQWRANASNGCGGCSSGTGLMGAGLVWCVIACLIALRREESP